MMGIILIMRATNVSRSTLVGNAAVPNDAAALVPFGMKFCVSGLGPLEGLNQGSTHAIELNPDELLVKAVVANSTLASSSMSVETVAYLNGNLKVHVCTNRGEAKRVHLLDASR